MAGSVFGVSKDPFPSWGRLGGRPGQFHGRHEKCRLLRARRAIERCRISTRFFIASGPGSGASATGRPLLIEGSLTFEPVLEGTRIRWSLAFAVDDALSPDLSGDIRG
jgi:hypothetical protein